MLRINLWKFTIDAFLRLEVSYKGQKIGLGTRIQSQNEQIVSKYRYRSPYSIILYSVAWTGHFKTEDLWSTTLRLPSVWHFPAASNRQLWLLETSAVFRLPPPSSRSKKLGAWFLMTFLLTYHFLPWRGYNDLWSFRETSSSHKLVVCTSSTIPCQHLITMRSTHR